MIAPFAIMLRKSCSKQKKPTSIYLLSFMRTSKQALAYSATTPLYLQEFLSSLPSVCLVRYGIIIQAKQLTEYIPTEFTSVLAYITIML